MDAAAQAELQVTLNGEPHGVAAGTTVTALLASLPGKHGPVAVEVNRTIVPRSAHATRTLAAGDTIEIVSFVGGG